MTFRTATAIAALLALGACSKSQDIDPESQFGPNPNLPEPTRGLLPNMHIPTVVGWGQGEAPTVPTGFKVQKMASDLNNPRNVYALPNGDVLVVLSKKTTGETVERPKDPVMAWMESQAHGAGGPPPKGKSNRIVLLRDANGDGTPEMTSNFIDGLNAPFGIVLVGNDLYVADTDAILRFPYTPGATQITARPQLVTDLPAGPINHHWTKSLTASPDGSKLYVGVGSNSNIMESGPEAERGRASIWEVDPKTGFKREYATGLRNPNGLTFYPGSNTLWAVVNERDELGPNLVPDYMTSVKEGAFYGWPYTYWGQHPDERVHPQRPDLVKTAIMPDYSLSSHVAPLSLQFYTGSQFPAKFSGGAFVAEHGSWNRDLLNGYRVVYIKFENGRPVGDPMNFVWGFVGENGKARGRPVGLTMDRTGALIIADDAGNSVWRVSYAMKPFKVSGAQMTSF
jgi:glucose/arabinose dehydrogenase